MHEDALNIQIDWLVGTGFRHMFKHRHSCERIMCIGKERQTVWLDPRKPLLRAGASQW
jgi:hypothetical protein